MKVAIFDFDGTLLRGNSYHEFFGLMIARHPMRSPVLLGWLLLRKLRIVSALSLKNRVLGALRGASREEVSALGFKLFNERLRDRLRVAGLRELQLRREEGCTLVLITRGFDFIAEPFARDYRFDLFRASKVAYNDNDYCLGRVEGDELYGQGKAEAAQRLAQEFDIEWEQSWAYGDEQSDVPVLSMVGNPVFVRTRKPLPQNLPSRFRLVSWET